MFKNKRSLFFVIFLLMLSLLASCGGGGEETEEPSGGRELMFDGESYVIFGSESKSNFDIVYDSDNTIFFANLVVDFCDLVVGKGLPKPVFSSDRDKTESKLELVIGDTDRAISAEAKAIVEKNAAKDPKGKHWIWLYNDGQLALYANDDSAYEHAMSEFSEEYFKDGAFKVKKDLKEIGYIESPHDAYMSYDIPDNFYDVYTDPFGIEAADYKKMTITLVNEKTYRIAYADERGGKFTADLVQKVWGVWNMGAITYVDEKGYVNNITNSSTDYEFVLRVHGKGEPGLKSGNHGNYPKDSLWKPWIDPETGKEDPTSYYNDMLVDITFYDGKTGNKLNLDKIGQSVDADGIRIIMHHNVYEFGYKQENVLINAERSYLYNGYDIMCDTKLYMTQNVRFGGSYSAMLPILKQYGNCCMFYCEDDSTIYMKTPMSNTVNESVYGANATYVDLWGENNPKYHMIVKLGNPAHQFINPAVGKNKGYAGFREMLGSNSNKLYFQFGGTNFDMEWGEELHFNTCWSFSIQDDFVNPDREPDFWVGVKK